MEDAYDGVGQDGQREQADHVQVERVFQVDEQANEKETEVGRQHRQGQARQELHQFVVIGADLAGNHDVVASDDNEDRHCGVDDTDRPRRKLHHGGVLVGACRRRLRNEVERTLVDGVDQRLQDIEDVLRDPLCSLTQPAIDIKGSAEGWNRGGLRQSFSRTRQGMCLLPLLHGRGSMDRCMWYCSMHGHPCCSDA